MSYNFHKRNIQVFLLFLGRILEPSRYIYLVAREKNQLFVVTAPIEKQILVYCIKPTVNNR